MKQLYLFFAATIGAVGALAQQPPDTSRQEAAEQYTIRLRKPTLILAEAPAEAVDSMTVVHRLPRLYEGVYGLMRVEPYSLPEAQSIYVVFSYAVNILGQVEQIEIHENNDSRLVRVLLRELSNSHWYPATNRVGQPILFRYPKQIVYFNGNDYEEDYDRN